MATPAFDLDSLDPSTVLDVDLFADDTRQDWFTRAADWATRPPFYVVNFGVPQVVVGRYADVREALMAPERFTSTPPVTAGARFDAFMGLTHLGTVNGTPHDRLRRILQPWFSSNGIARYEDSIETEIARLLDELESTGPEFDAIADFSRELIPRIMLGAMFDLDEDQRASFIRMNVELESVASADGYPAEYVAAFEEARQVIDEIIAARTQDPTEDFIGGLVAGRDRGEPITDDEIVANVFAICVAAMTTTSTTTSATLLAWMRHRDQFALLRSEPDLLAGAVEESLRLHPAGLFIFPRFVAVDTELGGTRLPGGLPVHICVAAANLDPEVFPDPLRFDIRRNPKHIMSFGAGGHFCAGAILARKIVQASLRAFMDRFPDLQLADPDYRPKYHGQLGETAPESMLMRLG
jgi:cytochrome P450